VKTTDFSLVMYPGLLSTFIRQINECNTNNNRLLRKKQQPKTKSNLPLWVGNLSLETDESRWSAASLQQNSFRHRDAIHCHAK